MKTNNSNQTLIENKEENNIKKIKSWYEWIYSVKYRTNYYHKKTIYKVHHASYGVLFVFILILLKL